MAYPIILNGDHAEFEREHANTKPEDRPDWPLPSSDAAARRLPEFIKTLRINRAARRESVYASDNVYALLDALDTAEARVRELDAELADQRTIAKYNREQAEKAERQLAEAQHANSALWRITPAGRAALEGSEK